MRNGPRHGTATTIRTLFAAMALLGIAGTASAAELPRGPAAAGAQAGSDAGPWLVNRNGSQEVARGARAGTVVGGANATIAGSGDDLHYQAAPGGRTQTGTALAATAVNVNGTTEVVHLPRPDAARGTPALAGAAGGARTPANF